MSLPPRQIETRRWPVIGERDPETFDERTWRLDVAGLVSRPLSLSRADLAAMPQSVLRGTIHCVTRWSRPSVAFRGVRVADLVAAAGADPSARFVRFVSGRGHDTSLPVPVACADVLVADGVDLEGREDGPFSEIPATNGGPVRTVILSRYFYKSVKWVRRIELLDDDRLGFWERTAGYHNEADPWRELRYVAAAIPPAELKRRLASRDLAGLDLRSADLSGADLAGASLRGTSLRNATLPGAVLRGADLTGANFTNADLRGADLRDARIDAIDFDGADLRRADLRGARGVPSSLAVVQFHSSPDDGAIVDGVTWSGARLDGLLPHEEAWLRARGVV